MSLTIVSRKEWGAQPWNGTPNTVPLSARTEFFVHWHGGQPPASTGVRVPREIERIHLGQGWAGIGYNFVVDQDGVIYEGRGWDRQGAHCPDHNVTGLGVQVAIGKGQTATEAALQSVRALYDEACRKTGRTLAQRGHKDGFATECPGPELYAWVKAGMPTDHAEGNDRPAWDGKSFPGRDAFKLGHKHDAVTLLGQRLSAHGYGRFYKVGPGPTFSPADKAATAAFQKAQGWTGSDADGYPGPSTWARLMADPKPRTEALAPGVKPGARHPQVRDLQKLLIEAGYGPIKGAVTDYYGPNTQRAVARFHVANPAYRSKGRTYDPAIGAKGFEHLQRKANRK